jgi:hypothetical protein
MRGLNDPEFHNRIFYSRWKPAKNYGYNLHDFPSDANNYAKKSLLPLNDKPLQEKPFLRTNTRGWQFAHTVGSII